MPISEGILEEVSRVLVRGHDLWELTISGMVQLQQHEKNKFKYISQ